MRTQLQRRIQRHLQLADAPAFVNRDQEQWEAITSKENLDINIIDVYAEWCGPCKSIPQGARSALHIRQRLS